MSQQQEAGGQETPVPCLSSPTAARVVEQHSHADRGSVPVWPLLCTGTRQRQINHSEHLSGGCSGEGGRPRAEARGTAKKAQGA